MARRTRFLLNLAFSHRMHGSLFPPPSGSSNISYDGFSSLCENAGVARIAFLRHGKTAPRPEEGSDFDRVLTEEGRQQAKEAGGSFGRDLRPIYHSLLVSPAPRTMETAELFKHEARDPPESPCQLVPVQSLYDGIMQPKGGQLFQKIGYAPLSDYLDSSDSEDRELARSLLGSYADTVVGAMADAMEPSANSAPQRATNTTLWMVGHAIYLPAAALRVASLVGCGASSLETILSTNTKEAEGYLINIEKAEATYLARPSTKQG